ANLRNALLLETNLTGANLKGAVMPDGTRHE
ncbi:MAG: pentapeptide repeat-containing protein, partial [Oscillatoriales cyanobacterium]